MVTEIYASANSNLNPQGGVFYLINTRTEVAEPEAPFREIGVSYSMKGRPGPAFPHG